MSVNSLLSIYFMERVAGFDPVTPTLAMCPVYPGANVIIFPLDSSFLLLRFVVAL